MSHTDKNIFTEEHKGKKVKWYLEDGSLLVGTITGFPNENHVKVSVDRGWGEWEWYVRNETVLFV